MHLSVIIEKAAVAVSHKQKRPTPDKGTSIFLIKRFLFIVCSMAIINSCSGQNKSINDEIKRAVSASNIQDAVTNLMELDQKYNKNIEIKTNLGALLLKLGEVDRAGIYLTSAEKLSDKKSIRCSDESLYLLYVNLGEYYFRSTDFSRVKICISKALKHNKDDPVHGLMTKAKAEYLLDEWDNAYNDFKAYWVDNKRAFNREDLTYFIKLLLQKNEFKEALDVMEYYESTFGFEPGIGIYQSVAFEKTGNFTASITAMTKELDYKRFYGEMTVKQVLNNYTDLEKKLKSVISPEDYTEALLLIKGYSAYYKEEWNESLKILTQFSGKIEMKYLEFLIYTNRLKNGTADEEDFAGYINFESIFNNHPGFYYHLWRGMKKGEGNYSLKTVRSVLEKVIILAPETEYADESRNELSRLLCLPENN